MFWEAPGSQCSPLPPRRCSSSTASSQPRATALRLEHSCLLAGTGSWYWSCSPLNCWTHPISEMQRWCHGVLPATQAQYPLCHLACRAQYLHGLGSKLSRSSKAVAELPDRPGLTVTGAREPFKANHHLLFQPQHYEMLQANSNSPFPQSNPRYQL